MNVVPQMPPVGAPPHIAGGLDAFRRHKSGRWWVLDADLQYWDGSRWLLIPCGFRWNGASVPWTFRWYEGRADHLAASCVHDWLYQYHYVLAWDAARGAWLYIPVSKRYADRQWYQILEHVYCVRHTKDFVLWYVVHVGGWFIWSYHPCNLFCEICDVYPEAGRAHRCCQVFGLRKIENIKPLE